MQETQDEVLPTSEEALEVYMSEIIELYSLPDSDDTRDMIATMILHLPQTAARKSRTYFAEGVLKSMANKAAFDKLKVYKARRDEAELKLKAEQEATQKTGLTLVDHVESIQNT